jgi:hypothetical protein
MHFVEQTIPKEAAPDVSRMATLTPWRSPSQPSSMSLINRQLYISKNLHNKKKLSLRTLTIFCGFGG